MTQRAGFTLLETAIVLAITAVAALLVLPSWPNALSTGTNRGDALGHALVDKLADARNQAVSARQTVIVYIDVAQQRLRIDTNGVHGRGVWRDTILPLSPNEMLVTEDTATRIVFRATGSAQSRPMALRHDTGWLTLTVDPWNGEVHRVAR